jgi:DNA-binding transcriptional MerR regulator
MIKAISKKEVPMEDRFIVTTHEAAKLLDCSSESVRLFERKGALPAIKTAKGMRLFRESDVRALAKKRDGKKGSE